MASIDSLMSIDLKNLILNENAYFYHVSQKITQGEILRFFNEALKSKDAKREFQYRLRESFPNKGKEIAKFSLDIFSFKKDPPFFKEPEIGKREIKYGLFFIIEHGNHVAVVEKYVSGKNSIWQYLDTVDYGILAHFLITENSKFEKITSSNMNTADNAIQVKSSEAKDLKGIYSRFGASKQILNTIRLDTKGKKHTVALNTSRVNSLNLKSGYKELIQWASGIIDLIEEAQADLPKSPFVDSFATPLKFEDIIDTIVPTYILLRFGNLRDDIDSGKIESCYTMEDDKEKPVDILSEISKNDSLIQLTKIDNKKYGSDELEIRINDHSISLNHHEFKKIYLDFGNDYQMTLNQYLNNGNNFIVNFDKVDHVYSHRKIFRDNKLLGDVENFLSVFQTFNELKSIKSEKGLANKTTTTSFEIDSLFKFIEDKFIGESEVLICDDQGVEWGDFISIAPEEITFYHAKYNKKGLSASNLENVFGQAQKNFGYLQLDSAQIDYRYTRWLNNYKIDGVLTSISRIRKCPAGANKIDQIKKLAEQVTANPNLKRRVFIVINFISKKALEDGISKLKAGQNFHHKGVTLQILWFVNSLLSSANELNTELRILCQP